MDELKAGQAIIQDLTAKLRVQMERAEKAEGERDKLRATLEQYATESSWIQSEADDVVGPFGDFD